MISDGLFHLFSHSIVSLFLLVCMWLLITSLHRCTFIDSRILFYWHVNELLIQIFIDPYSYGTIDQNGTFTLCTCFSFRIVTSFNKNARTEKKKTKQMTTSFLWQLFLDVELSILNFGPTTKKLIFKIHHNKKLEQDERILCSKKRSKHTQHTYTQKKLIQLNRVHSEIIYRTTSAKTFYFYICVYHNDLDILTCFRHHCHHYHCHHCYIDVNTSYLVFQ